MRIRFSAVLTFALLTVSACRDVIEPGSPGNVRIISPLFAISGPGITDLGTLGGPACTPVAITASGAVAGSAYTPTNNVRAMLWTPAGGMRELGRASMQSQAYDVNDRGEAAGFSDGRGVYWSDTGEQVDLGNLPGQTGTNLGAAGFAINNAGQVVGYALHASSGGNHAFIWTRDAGMKDLGLPPGTDNSIAVDINDRGEVVGYAYSNFTFLYRAFLWTPAGGMRDLGNLGSPYMVPLRINAAGQVLGQGQTSTFQSRAWMWDPITGLRDLGSLLAGSSSFAAGINERGHVVGTSISGTSSDPFSIPMHAFLWTPELGMVDLGTSGGSRSNADGINSAGQIIGSSTDATGRQFPVVWNGVTRPIELPNLPGGFGARTIAINDAGQATGVAFASGRNNCVVWTLPTTPPNQDPSADAGGPYLSITGTAVTFDGSASSDADGDVLTYDWDFGDGTASANAGPNPTHAYANAGTYVATLNVSDDKGGRSGATASVTVLSPAGAAAALGDQVAALLTSGAVTAQLAGQLTASTSAASASLAKGNTEAATGQLSAFINKVQAAVQSGKMSAEAGAALIANAQAVLNSIGS